MPSHSFLFNAKPFLQTFLRCLFAMTFIGWREALPCISFPTYKQMHHLLVPGLITVRDASTQPGFGFSSLPAFNCLRRYTHIRGTCCCVLCAGPPSNCQALDAWERHCAHKRSQHLCWLQAVQVLWRIIHNVYHQQQQLRQHKQCAEQQRQLGQQLHNTTPVTCCVLVQSCCVDSV